MTAEFFLPLILLLDSIFVRFSDLGYSKDPAHKMVSALRSQWQGDRFDHFVKY